MKKTDIDVKLKILNNWVEDWRQGFENPPEPFLTFSSDEAGNLLLNNTPLCSVSLVNTDGRFVSEAEYLEFPLANNSCIVIALDWPFEGPPKVQFIEHRECLYLAG